MLRHKQKFVRVEQRSAKRGDAMLADDGLCFGEFFAGGLAAEGELVSTGDLPGEIITSFLPHS